MSTVIPQSSALPADLKLRPVVIGRSATRAAPALAIAGGLALIGGVTMVVIGSGLVPGARGGLLGAGAIVAAGIAWLLVEMAKLTRWGGGLRLDAHGLTLCGLLRSTQWPWASFYGAALTELRIGPRAAVWPAMRLVGTPDVIDLSPYDAQPGRIVDAVNDYQRRALAAETEAATI